jgi:hypothetical protein
VSDYAIYRTIGDAWAHGVVPYRELFDSTGPMLFFIQALGSIANNSKIAMYVIESLFMTWTLVLLVKIGKTIAPGCRRRIVLSLAATLFVFVYTIECGNTNEQYSLPFVLYPLYVAVRHFFAGRRIALTDVLLSGLCFGCVSLIRLNNTAIIAGVCIALLCEYIRLRKYKSLLKNTVAFLGAALVVWLPFVLYFAAHSALYDMIYASILYNVKYKAAWGETRYFVNFARLLSCIVLPALSLAYDRAHGERVSLLCIPVAAITFVTFIGGAGYAHYYTMALPVLFMCAMMARLRRRALSVALVLLMCAPVTYSNCIKMYMSFRIKTGTYRDGMPNYEIYKDSLDDLDDVRDAIFAVIPEADRDSVYINSSMSYGSIFVGAGLHSVGKYFFLQQSIANVDTAARCDIIAHFNAANPKWIVSSIPLDSEYSLISFAADRYRLVARPTLPNSAVSPYIYCR